MNITDNRIFIDHRTIYNPVQKDYVTFLETSAESGGKRTRCLLIVAPGGKVLPHFHLSYSETFVVQSGILNVRIDDKDLSFTKGEQARVPPGVLHAWSNQQSTPIEVEVIIEPGHVGFERVLQAVYGLARDGKTLPDGKPKNIFHLALLLDMGDMKLPGLMGRLGGLLRLLARIAYKRGIHRDFEKYYLKF